MGRGRGERAKERGRDGEGGSGERGEREEEGLGVMEGELGGRGVLWETGAERKEGAGWSGGVETLLVGPV